ncbi:MAG TPA: hypothetical protein PKH65_00410 [Bacteroidia bacterium]|nr:hypothetical protein [Bacteroidia bacterium]HNT79114.1 hypothetical protein [Bacteroidia bacterium]
MKSIIKIICIGIFLSLSVNLNAQNADFGNKVVTIDKPSSKSMGEFTEWTKMELVLEDGSKGEIEYRIALANRKGIACHYQVEVKNNTSAKLKLTFDSNYYDKLVKSHFGEKKQGTVKPGAIMEATLIAQGCKKEKGKELSDFENCMACDFFVDLYAMQLKSK